MTREDLMRKAIELSKENVENGGGPFGAVIATKEGEIVATGVNRVTASCDPTAHAEVSAIRAAAAKLGTFNLSGYEIYTSCEPCPMCLGAIYWARLDKMYYGNNKTDAKNIGFDDSFIYDELELKPEDRKLPSEILLHNEALTAFKAWAAKEVRVEYFNTSHYYLPINYPSNEKKKPFICYGISMPVQLSTARRTARSQ